MGGGWAGEGRGEGDKGILGCSGGKKELKLVACSMNLRGVYVKPQDAGWGAATAYLTILDHDVW